MLGTPHWCLIYFIVLVFVFVVLLVTMAHLPSAEIAARREAATQDILSVWNTIQGAEWYSLQCPCRIDCGCMPEDEVPRIVLNNCMYVGELDFFFVTQPFEAPYGFKV